MAKFQQTTYNAVTHIPTRELLSSAAGFHYRPLSFKEFRLQETGEDEVKD